MVMNSSRRLITWGWILVALIPATIIAYALIYFIANASGSEPGNPVMILANTLVFIIGAVGVFGFPAGIVLLIVGYTQRHKPPVIQPSNAPGPEILPPQ